MRLTMLQHLAGQAAEAVAPHSVSMGESVLLAFVTALIAFGGAYGLMRGQVTDLRKRVDDLEKAREPLAVSMARVETRLDGVEKSVLTAVDSLRRELHASGALPRAARGDG